MNALEIKNLTKTFPGFTLENLDNYMVLMLMLLIMAAITSSISLPFLFKLGVEKGRIAYYVMVGVACAGSTAASDIFTAASHTEMQLNGILLILCLVRIGIYALSWYLSILFYRKREIN